MKRILAGACLQAYDGLAHLQYWIEPAKWWADHGGWRLELWFNSWTDYNAFWTIYHLGSATLILFGLRAVMRELRKTGVQA